jgi:hypothetical protein
MATYSFRSTPRRLSRLLVLFVFLFSMSTAAVAVAPSALAYSVSGEYVLARCPDGMTPKGLWYSAPGHASGWARDWGMVDRITRKYSFGAPTWTNVSVTLGCGATSWTRSYPTSIYIAYTPVDWHMIDCGLPNRVSCAVYGWRG